MNDPPAFGSVTEKDGKPIIATFTLWLWLAAHQSSNPERLKVAEGSSAARHVNC